MTSCGSGWFVAIFVFPMMSSSPHRAVLGVIFTNPVLLSADGIFLRRRRKTLIAAPSRMMMHSLLFSAWASLSYVVRCFVLPDGARRCGAVSWEVVSSCVPHLCRALAVRYVCGHWFFFVFTQFVSERELEGSVNSI